MWKLVPVLVREMGQAYPELMRAEALITETLKLEETRFRKTLERGLSILDEETKSLKQGDMSQGRDRVHALRHLWLPARPDAGRAARRAASASISRLQRRDGAAAGQKARASWAGSGDAAADDGLVSAPREGSAPPNSSATRPRRAEGVVTALVRDGKEVAELKAGESGAVVRQPDAVLWRVRRPGRRHRHDARATACASRSPTPRRKPATCSCITARSSRARSRSAMRCARSRSRAALGDPPQPLGDASAARGAAPGARRSRRAEGLAGRAGPAALRLLASEADDGRGDRAGRGHRQRHRAAEFAGDDAADGARRRARLRRARAVRREIWRRGARRGDGRGVAATPWAGRSNSAAAPMCAAPATSA